MLEGGDLNWITEGLQKVDKRIARFSELNEILAFRPWAVSMNHLQRILSSEDGSPSLSPEQLVKGVIVLSHFHGLACFVLGNGLNEDS